MRMMTVANTLKWQMNISARQVPTLIEEVVKCTRKQSSLIARASVSSRTQKKRQQPGSKRANLRVEKLRDELSKIRETREKEVQG